MRKFLSYVLFVLLGIVMIVFLVANRQAVFISLDPTTIDNPAFALGPMPLWAALVFTLVIGFGLGALGMWLSAGPLRQKARERKREVSRLREELRLLSDAPAKKSKMPALRG